MADPVTFPSTSPRFELPFLFAGQAQKEFFVNEAIARLDALLHPSIEGQLATRPDQPEEGRCWIVAVDGVGEWAGKAGKIAAFAEGRWTYVTPQDGMVVYDRSQRQLVKFTGTWMYVAAPSAPSGGETVDAEARAAIVAIIQRLKDFGIFSGL